MTMESRKSLIGENLRLARLAHGLSLEEVGEAVSTTRQFIHQLETGARAATPDMIAALADFFGVSTYFFFRPISSTVRPEHCHFRKQQTTPVSITSQVLARGTLLDCLINSLEYYLELPEVNFPDISVETNEEIETAAERARLHWKLGRGPIISMMRVVENAGAVVTYFGDLSERIDAFSMDRPRPIIVRSSLKESLCRQRFDLAHECAHLIMHRGIQTGDRATEDQAHRFAGAFLVPRAAMLTEFPRSQTLDWAAIYELKLRWGISARALVRRAFDLRIIDATQYRTANVRLMKTGQSKSEKYDAEMCVEIPELLSEALRGMDEAYPRSTHLLADDVGLSGKMFTLITGECLPHRFDGGNDPKVVRLNPAEKPSRRS